MEMTLANEIIGAPGMRLEAIIKATCINAIVGSAITIVTVIRTSIVICIKITIQLDKCSSIVRPVHILVYVLGFTTIFPQPLDGRQAYEPHSRL